MNERQFIVECPGNYGEPWYIIAKAESLEIAKGKVEEKYYQVTKDIDNSPDE